MIGREKVFVITVSLMWNRLGIFSLTTPRHPSSMGLYVLATSSLIDLIDGALPVLHMLVERLFILHQTLWEIWLIKNKMVFQKCFVRFLATKVRILTAELMDAINREISSNRRTIRIKRARLFVQTPRERRSDRAQDGILEEDLPLDNE